MNRNRRFFFLSSLASFVVAGCVSAENVGDPLGGTDTSAQGGAESSTGGAMSMTSVGSTGGTRVATGGAGVVSSLTGGAATTGVGGSTNPILVGGATGMGGTTGISATGGAAASTTPAPANGLGVYVNEITGATGKIVFDIRIDNKTSQSVDTSAITLRYWYQDEGLGPSLTYNSDYVKIGYSVPATMSGKDSAASSPTAGADHYIEMSFTGTLAAQGDGEKKDQLTIHVTAHSGSWAGNVDLTNDYSYNTGAKGYDEKITLYSAGTLIWGTEPGTSVTPTGTGGASSIGTETGGATGSGGTTSIGGAGGATVSETGGSLGTAGASATGGVSSAGGESATGGATSGGDSAIGGGGVSATGGGAATGGNEATGGDSSIGGDTSTGGSSSETQS